MRKISLVLILFNFSLLYSQIPTNGLILALDASDSTSYPGSGNTWYDLSGQNAHAEALNLPSFGLNGAQIKNFDFDGTNDEFHSVNISQEYRDLIVITKLETNSGLPMLFAHYDNLDDSMRFDTGKLRNTGDGNDWQLGEGAAVFINGQFSQAGVSVFNTWSFIRTYRSNTSGFGTSFRYELSSSFSSRRYSGKVNLILAYNRKLSNQEVTDIYNTLSGRLSGNASPLFSNPTPEMSQTQIALNNSTVSVTFSELAYGGSSNSTSTLETSDFSLSLSGGSASLSSATPSSISVSGTTVGLGIPLSGTPNGSEVLTILPASNNSVFGSSGGTVSTTQTSNTTKLIPNLENDGLVLYVDSRNQGSYPGSGSTLYDLSGNNNNFTINGTMNYNTTNGFTFENSQTSKYFEQSNFAHPTSTFTNEILIKTSQTSNGGIVSYNKSNNDNANLIWIDNSNSGNIRTHTIGTIINSDANVSNNQWRHFVQTVDKSSGIEKIYLDGVLLETNSSNNTSIPSNGCLALGQDYDSTCGGFNTNDAFGGYLPVYRLYNKVLTAAEVTQNYNALIAPFIPPTNINLTSNTISETSSIGSVIGTLSAVDSDTSSSSLTFSFTSSGDSSDDDNGSFTISGTTLLTSTTLDYETKTSYNIYINVSDGLSNFAKAFTVSVTNIYEPPTNINLTSNTISETSSIGSVIGTLSAVDSDTSSSSLTFSFTSSGDSSDDDNGSFTISGTALLTSTTLDYETKTSYNIYINVSDGNNTFSKAFTITVNDINEPPIISSTTLASNNATISVTFSELVYGGSSNSTSTLQTSDFSLSLSGGSASLSSATPSSISVSGTTVGLGISLSGTPNGSEVLTISPSSNAIFDVQGLTASSTQSSNTVNLNADSDADGVTDPLDQCANTPNGESVDANGCAESQKDPDNDGISGVSDNCPTTANADQADGDSDGVGDLCDNCPNASNTSQLDTDADGLGDTCDTDDDNDGVLDIDDAFPTNPLETLDTDGDGFGNNQDLDDDDDGLLDTSDNCPAAANVDQLDTDGDGLGDVCDTDDDNDGYSDGNEYGCNSDMLSATSTPPDMDKDFICDLYDNDIDGDNVLNYNDAFPEDSSEWSDTDSDGTGDNTDTDDDNDGFSDTDESQCGTDPLSANSVPVDSDSDSTPDCVDQDDDNDSYLDTEDLFPLDPNEWADTDGDSTGDNSDTDDDNDGYSDQDEISCQSDPLDTNNVPLDFDKDLSPDCVDQDDDNDQCPDTEDDFPLDSRLCMDCDNDGIDNRYEFDSDNDGIGDYQDEFPCNPQESFDTDKDGIGDNQDLDDNNDGFPDDGLIVSTVLTPNENGLESTWKAINIDKYPFTKVRVYSPAGSLVYQSRDYQNDWKGENIRTGDKLPSGPYYYRIVLGGTNGEIKEGWLYIFN